MRYAASLIALSLLAFGCSHEGQRAESPIISSVPGERTASSTGDPIEVLALKAPFVTGVERAYPGPPSTQVVALLKSKKTEGPVEHFGFLLEYGLRVHWQHLEHTRLSRELPVESNMMLAELVRLAEIPKYRTAHQAGWLNSQFHGKFNQVGWSSYQIYVWAKEHSSEIFSDTERFPNWKRIGTMLDTIDGSSFNGIGGKGVCHYGCI